MRHLSLSRKWADERLPAGRGSRTSPGVDIAIHPELIRCLKEFDTDRTALSFAVL
jgi:hypothetical protein